MDIGQAVASMKDGKRVARAGWNGKGMWLAYQPGYPDGIPINANTAKAMDLPVNTIVAFLPYVMMKTATGPCVPWLCSRRTCWRKTGKWSPRPRPQNFTNQADLTQKVIIQSEPQGVTQ